MNSKFELDESIFLDQLGKENLIVTFGGIMGKLPFPIFEFWNSLGDLDCDRVFIRDCAQCWYQKGFFKHTSSIEDSIKFLKILIQKFDYKNVVFIGNSAEGYAALLFGNILNISKVLAFAPQTFISKWLRFYYRDKRWKNEIRVGQLYGNRMYFDLHRILRNSSVTENVIYYSVEDYLDAAHAKRLNGFSNVKLINVEKGGHNVIKVLKDNGELINLIQSILV